MSIHATMDYRRPPFLNMISHQATFARPHKAPVTPIFRRSSLSNCFYEKLCIKYLCQWSDEDWTNDYSKALNNPKLSAKATDFLIRTGLCKQYRIVKATLLERNKNRTVTMIALPWAEWVGCPPGSGYRFSLCGKDLQSSGNFNAGK